MKKTWFFLPAAVLLTAAPLQAQNLTWFGSTACFGGATSSPSNRVIIPSCNLNSSTSTSMSWDSNDNSNDRSSISFSINEYNAADWPGGPASNAASNRSLAFNSVGQTRNLYLGYWSFDRDEGNDLLSAFLSMNLYFDAGTLNLNNNLKIEDVNQSGGDAIRVLGIDNPVAFSFGGYNYEFRYTGFDNWTNNQPNTESNYCQGAVDNALPVTFTNDVQRKLCGSITYTGRTQVAEPATLSLVAAGLMGLVGVARRRRDEA